IIIRAEVIAVVMRRVAVAMMPSMIAMVPAIAVNGRAFDAGALVVTVLAGVIDRHRVFLIGRIRRERAGAGIGRALVHVIVLSRGRREVLEAPTGKAVMAAGAAARIAVGIGRRIGVGRHISLGAGAVAA